MGARRPPSRFPAPCSAKPRLLAAQQGLSLKDFFTQALSERLRRKAGGPEEKPWMRAFGGLRELHSETKRLERLVAEEFERIDQEEWR